MTPIDQPQNLQHLKSQVVKILLQHAGNGSNGHSRLAQRDIATMLGTAVITVHQALNSLYCDGAIKIDRNRITINKEMVQREFAGI